MKTDFKIALWMASPAIFLIWVAVLASIYTSAKIHFSLIRCMGSLGLGVLISAVPWVLGYLVTPFFYEEPTEEELKDPRLLNGKRFWKRIAAGCLYGAGIFLALLIFGYVDTEAAHRGEAMMLGVIYGIIALPCLAVFYSLWAFRVKKRELP